MTDLQDPIDAAVAIGDATPVGRTVPRGTVLTNVDPALRRAWHPVGRSTDVGEGPMKVRLLGEDWALVRLPSGLAAYADRCPHRLAPLSAGHVEGDVLRCGYHGWCFDAAGSCTEIPALGDDARLPPRARATVPAGLTEHAGMVWLAPEPPLAGLLDVPELDDPAFLVGHLPVIQARVGAGLMIDNFLDMAHFPFVHADTIGTAEAEEVGDLEIERDGFAMTVRSSHPFPNHEDPGVASGERALVQTRHLTYEYRAPFSITLRIAYEEAGGVNALSFFVQPEDADRCRIYTSVMRNDLGGSEARMADAVAYEERIVGEDLALQERFAELSLPLDLTTEVHVKADRMTVELRRLLADFVTAPPDT